MPGLEIDLNQNPSESDLENPIAWDEIEEWDGPANELDYAMVWNDEWVPNHDPRSAVPSICAWSYTPVRPRSLTGGNGARHLKRRETALHECRESYEEAKSRTMSAGAWGRGPYIIRPQFLKKKNGNTPPIFEWRE